MFAKKNVVAAAVLTLLAVTAQAQVSVYGQLDVSVGRKQALVTDNNGVFVTTGSKINKAGATTVDSSDMSQSYLGFKGQEDLGNGLKAVFKLESDLAVDTGATTAGAFWSRNATVGLVGDFGALNLGRFETLTKLEGAAFNPFGASGTFSPTMRLASVETGSWSNGISYVSPNLSGLTLSAQYSAKEAASAADGTRAYAASANYTAGPLAVSVVYSDRKLIVAPSTAKDRDWLLGASYDLGMAKLYAQYGRGKFTIAGATTSETQKSDFFQVGAGIPVGADGTVLLALAQGKNKNAAYEGSDKVRDFSMGYTHKLSKRTNVYAALINERTTAGLDQAPDLKGTTNSVAVGVRHAF